VRCFKSVEIETINYTITYIQDEEETTDTAVYGDYLTEPSHKDK
jgi:hypothetical protein